MIFRIQLRHIHGKISCQNPLFMCLLPPAYVVRREGNSFTLFVCPHRGGGGSPPGGYPGQVPPRGVPGSGTPPPGGYPGQVHPPQGGTGPGYPPRGDLTQVPPRGTQVWYPPGGYLTRVPPLGGIPDLGQVPPPRGVPGSGTPPGGYPGQVPPPGGYRPWVPRGGTGPGYLGGGYPGRTTEGVLTTRRAVCLLRSRRRTFLCYYVNI